MSDFIQIHKHEIKNEPERVERPTAVLIFALLTCFGGSIATFLSLFALTNMSYEMDSLPTLPTHFLLSIAFCGALTIVTGVGLLSGEKWAWWLYISSSLFVLSGYLFFFVANIVNSGLLKGFSYPSQSFIVTAISSFYFFTKPVQRFFGFDET